MILCRLGLFSWALVVLAYGVTGSRQTCLSRKDVLLLDCGRGAEIHVREAAVLGDCSEAPTTRRQLESRPGDDVITARVRIWCEGRAECHVAASTWYPADLSGRTSLRVTFTCMATVQNRSTSMTTSGSNIDSPDTPDDATSMGVVVLVLVVAVGAAFIADLIVILVCCCGKRKQGELAVGNMDMEKLSPAEEGKARNSCVNIAFKEAVASSTKAPPGVFHLDQEYESVTKGVHSNPEQEYRALSFNTEPMYQNV